MSDANLGSAASAAGSPQIGNGVPNPNSLGGAMGQTPSNQAPQVDSAQHKELEALVGRQGQELGEYRKFFSDIAPLLDKLDKSPEIVQAVLGGNLTADLAKAAMEGKVKIEDAQIVSKAHEQVRQALGKEGYTTTSPDDINKLVEAKAQEIKSEFENKFRERDELSAFESEVSDFITRTPDFAQYADQIDKWIDTHDVTDISVAYYAVKGELSEQAAQAKADADKAEYEKGFALNQGGSTGRATHLNADSPVIDQLIASKSNPNQF